MRSLSPYFCAFVFCFIALCGCAQDKSSKNTELSLRQENGCDDYNAFCHDDDDQCCDCLGLPPIRTGGVGDEDNDGCYLAANPCCRLGIIFGDSNSTSNDTSGCADEAVYCPDDKDHCCRCFGSLIAPIKIGGPGDEDNDGCYLRLSVCCSIGLLLDTDGNLED